MVRKFPKPLSDPKLLSPLSRKGVELTQVSQKAPNEVTIRWNGGFSTSLSKQPEAIAKHDTVAGAFRNEQ
jgi:hypothetical protein